MDKLSPARIDQGAQGLFVVIRVEGDCPDHDGLGIAAKRVLEYSGEFGVTVGDIYFLVVFEVG